MVFVPSSTSNHMVLRRVRPSHHGFCAGWHLPPPGFVPSSTANLHKLVVSSIFLVVASPTNISQPGKYEYYSQIPLLFTKLTRSLARVVVLVDTVSKHKSFDTEPKKGKIFFLSTQQTFPIGRRGFVMDDSARKHAIGGLYHLAFCAWDAFTKEPITSLKVHQVSV